MLLAESLLGSSSAVAATYIEDVFSTYLYTGTGSTLSISNGIDLSTKGGLVFIKNRTNGGTAWSWVDTARGIYQTLESQNTGAQTSRTTGITAFNTTGFTMGSYFDMNTSATNYASWTFRKQAKFFDVVTYTGNGTTQEISHNLGSVPGCIFVKRTSAAEDWIVYHRSLSSNGRLKLNGTNAEITTGVPANYWGNGTTTVAPTSTVFTVGNATPMNASGSTYVAYLFAHDAGGFGAAGTDNVISCGSFTASSGAATVNLGYEPQWVLYKRTDDTDDWKITDNMRGMFAPTTNGYVLYPNLSNAEAQGAGAPYCTSTGFSFDGVNNGPGSTGGTYIYIAIRRGPMKTPTIGTSVFAPAYASSSGTYTATAGFPVDLTIYTQTDSSQSRYALDRLRGQPYLLTNTTAAETTGSTIKFDSNTKFIVDVTGNYSTWINWMFGRAPGFFDVVCYTGTGSATTFNHNLGVAPELVIVKWRTGATGENWAVMCTAASSSPDKRFLYLDLNAAGGGLNGIFADSGGTPVLPTATQVYIGTNEVVNKNAATYVSYLFATVAGVSKVFSYTGNGSSQTINCGFTGGARFVLIKRTDSTGNWTVFDSARGIVAGNDPALYLNSTAAEVTTIDAVDTDSSGFIVNQDATLNLNVNNATYIGLAIA